MNDNLKILYQPEHMLLSDTYWEAVDKTYLINNFMTRIRREHFDDYVNSKIIGLDQDLIISSENLKDKISNSKAEFKVITHLSNELYKYGDILEHIKWAKNIGFKEIHFIGNIENIKSKNYLYGIFIYFGLDFNGDTIVKNMSKKDDDIIIYFELN